MFDVSFSTTIVFAIASIVCQYLDQMPIQYKYAIVPPHVSIVSILACRIFRELKLGISPGYAFKFSYPDVRD